MRRILPLVAVAALLGCSDSTSPKWSESDGQAGVEVTPNAFPLPEEQKQPLPPQQVVPLTSSISSNCDRTKTACWRKIAEAGLALRSYFNNAVTMRPYSPTGGTSTAYVYANYSVTCTGPTGSVQCFIRYLGAATLTIAVPEACATVVMCAATIAGAGLAWNDYFTYDDGSIDIPTLNQRNIDNYNYNYPRWTTEFPERQ